MTASRPPTFHAPALHTGGDLQQRQRRRRVTSDAHMTEEQLQRRILDYCLLRGLLVFHDNDSRRNNAGFPDLVIVGKHGVIFAELKSEKGRVRPEQETWLLRLRAAGSMAYLWRPSHWPTIIQRLDAIR